MENAESYSDSYRKLEQLIRRGELNLSALEHLLNDLVAQHHLTSAEQEALLALAWVNKTDHKPSA